MRGLTVRQPWAWAIAHAGKRVENRTRSLGPYRGLVLITASVAFDDFPDTARLAVRSAGGRAVPADLPLGAAVAVARLTDVHESVGCCAPWGQSGVVHHLLGGVVALPEPIPCRGALGLWTVDDELQDQVQRALRGAAVAR